MKIFYFIAKTSVHLKKIEDAMKKAMNAKNPSMTKKVVNSAIKKSEAKDKVQDAKMMRKGMK